jgi:outer membrane lipase/esterase
MKYLVRTALAVTTVAAALAACGGGGGNSGETKVRISAVKVVGASLADSGTYGYKFTVQSSSGTAYQVYSERIASTYGLGLCAHFIFTGSGYNTDAECNNYAVAGAAINYGSFTDTNADTVDDTFTAKPGEPSSQLLQLTAMGQAGFGSGDLLIVGEGSSNDAATLTTAYLTDAQTQGNTTLFAQVLSSLNDATVTSALGTGNPVTAGSAYMAALANQLVDSINTNALANGATRVAVLNTLDVTRTPRFQAVLAGIAAGPGGQTAADQVQALVRAWINAYNTALNTAVASYAGKIVVVDAYQGFNDELDNLAQYGLTNKTATVCDQTYQNSISGTPTLATAGDTSLNSQTVLGTCVDTTASAMTPSESATGTNWWKTYLFADNFHPTPYGHQLLAQRVAKRLTEAGWL